MNPKTEIVKALTRSIKKCDQCNAANGGEPCTDCREVLELIRLLSLPNVIVAFRGDE